MSTESDPPIIQADVPFSVEAVRSKSGLIDALAKRPRLSTSEVPETADVRSGLVDPSRQITDTRARIAQDLEPATDAATPLSEVESAAALAPEPTAAPANDVTLSSDPVGPAASTQPVPLSELERRMLDIKSTNQHVTRELEALEESLRQPPAAV